MLMLTLCGISAVWAFQPVEIDLPDDETAVATDSVAVADSLATDTLSA